MRFVVRFVGFLFAAGTVVFLVGVAAAAGGADCGTVPVVAGDKPNSERRSKPCACPGPANTEAAKATAPTRGIDRANLAMVPNLMIDVACPG